MNDLTRPSTVSQGPGPSCKAINNLSKASTISQGHQQPCEAMGLLYYEKCFLFSTKWNEINKTVWYYKIVHPTYNIVAPPLHRSSHSGRGLNFASKHTLKPPPYVCLACTRHSKKKENENYLMVRIFFSLTLTSSVLWHLCMTSIKTEFWSHFCAHLIPALLLATSLSS